MSSPDRSEKEALLLFEIEAHWDVDGDTTIVRYVEAQDLRSALTVVPEECAILRVNTLGGLYRTVPAAITHLKQTPDTHHELATLRYGHNSLGSDHCC